MVGAEELRIGNYVLKDGIPIRTIARDIYRISNGLTTREPITLTEEWLIKSGFRKSNEKLYFLPIPLLSMEIHAVFFRNEWLVELSNDRKNIVTEVLKLHQLQNLYFALTGKELEVK